MPESSSTPALPRSRASALQALGPRPGDIALIAYLPGTLATFLSDLTERLAPAAPQAHPHLTLLPPQPPPMPVPEFLNHLRQTVADDLPFAIRLGDMATFLPISEVLYLELTRGMRRARALHHKLVVTYRGSRPERFRYHPHVTLAYALPRGEITRLLPVFHTQWGKYDGPRQVTLPALTLVRLSAPKVWDDLGTVKLGSGTA